MSHSLFSQPRRLKLASLALLGTLAGCSLTPTPLSQTEIATTISQDRTSLYQHQPPVTRTLSLYDVMARALQYNLEFRTQQLSERIAHGQMELARFDMLPALTGEAGKISRDNVNASRSISIFNGQETLEPSTSQEQHRGVANLKFSWNVLDFGVSYLQAKQEADRYLISEGSRRKVSQALISQARNTYWQALAAQQLSGPVKDIHKQATDYLSQLDTGLERKAFRNPLQVLKLKRQLLEAIQEIEGLLSSLNQAQVAMAQLINVPLKRLPELQPMAMNIPPSLRNTDMDALELTALSNSSDMIGQIYSTRIEQLETRKAILRLLPGLEFGYSENYDENRFLHNNDWGEASTRVTWNIMRLASAPSILDNSELRQAMAEQRRLAVTMAIITQLNLSLQQVAATTKQYQRSAVITDIDQQIARQTSSKFTNQAGSSLEHIQAQIASLMTQVNYWQDFSALQDAYGSLLNALGLFPAPDDYTQIPLDTLAVHIQVNLERWQQGQLPLLQPPASPSTDTTEACSR